MVYFEHISSPLSMEDNFNIHTPTSGAMKKTFILLFLSLIGLFIALFAFKFLSILWTLKYGNAQEKQALDERINSGFTISPELSAKQSAKSSTKKAVELIHSYNPVFGIPKAPIKVVAFIDFECPYSQQAYPVLKQIMDQYDGAVQVVFKQFPLDTIHPNARIAALASTCAEEQNKFWEYYNLLFQNRQFDDASLLSFAETAGLDTAEFSACLKDERYKQNIGQDLQDGVDAGVRGTPTFIVEDKKVEGALDKKTWDQIIINALEQKQPSQTP